MRFKLALITIIIFSLNSCIERGKPVEKKDNKQEKSKKSKIAHYMCPNGHAGADQQGKCTECGAVLIHNQAYHGLNIPQNGINDPFGGSNNSNTSNPAPAQNQYGDYHYICPNGHPGGSGTAGECATCSAKLTHNQNYHK